MESALFSSRSLSLKVYRLPQSLLHQIFTSVISLAARAKLVPWDAYGIPG